jgi:hypothetical protein
MCVKGHSQNISTRQCVSDWLFKGHDITNERPSVFQDM